MVEVEEEKEDVEKKVEILEGRVATVDAGRDVKTSVDFLGALVDC